VTHNMNRRQFVYQASCAALFACAPSAFATTLDKYDLIIKGGRVIDASSCLDAVRDVAISRGRIVAISASVTGESAEIIDARGKLVVPGLIDIHTHVARSAEGPARALKDGVTGWIDAGSQGADQIAERIAIARSSPQQGRVLINIGRAGISTEGDTMDLSRADVIAAREAISKNRDFIVGVKARLSADVAGANDHEVLRRAQEVANSFNVPVMIHMGQTTSPLQKLLPLLKRGDIVTHMFAPPPHSIIDEKGLILPEVQEARRRGVWFDVGNGRVGHIRWDIVEAVMKQKFWPDTISTDWNSMSPTNGVGDLPNCMSKFLHYGMSVGQVVACATLNASRVFPVFKNRGTLKSGAPADVALLELREGTFEFLDNYNNKIEGRQRLFPSGTALSGKRVQP
jgi:dihydroorotase